MLDPSGVRDRYQQFAAMARELLADFRQVEENFRTLDRRVREKIAGMSINMRLAAELCLAAGDVTGGLAEVPHSTSSTACASSAGIAEARRRSDGMRG